MPHNVAIPDEFADWNVPHIDQYFGIWAILEDPFRAVVDRVNRIDLESHITLQQARAGQTEARADRFAYPVIGSVAVMDVTGPLMKYASSLSGGTSTAILRRQIRTAAADDEIAAILLKIDSPGGTVSGTADLAADIRTAAKQKPTVAYVEDLGASAAYWLASQCRQVYSNPTGMVGSIGTFATIYDWSAYAAKEGLKVHVLRAGEHKGAGTPGTEVTPEQLAEWQRLVNEHNAHFLRGVQEGRKLSNTAVAELADGRVHIGQAAVDNRLTDGVKTFDEVLSSLRVTSKTRGNRAMSTDPTPAPAPEATTEPPAPQAATYDQIKSACSGADAAFICSQLDAKATTDQATKAWMAEQNQRIEASKAETEQVKAAAAKPGVDALGNGSGTPSNESAGDPIAQFNEAVAAKVKAGTSKARAISAVVKADPDLHAAYVAASNA
ncbi:MAG: S49 family peptidase [bacterium]|nr:S49 family peptidase [bacterium]